MLQGKAGAIPAVSLWGHSCQTPHCNIPRVTNPILLGKPRRLNREAGSRASSILTFEQKIFIQKSSLTLEKLLLSSKVFINTTQLFYYYCKICSQHSEALHSAASAGTGTHTWQPKHMTFFAIHSGRFFSSILYKIFLLKLPEATWPLLSRRGVRQCPCYPQPPPSRHK